MHTEPPPPSAEAPATCRMVPVMLDDLLLDAEHELEAFELETLADAVARARMELVRRCVLERLAPIMVDGLPDRPAPAPLETSPDLGLAERVARLFHEHYQRFAPGSQGTEPGDFEQQPDDYRRAFVAASAAVLSRVFPPDILEAIAHN